ncbi:MAG: sterol desaturase family protein [Flavobacteriaceae bacterium]|nr:sterol desaturase family protein [Flavobacteriaceae bacterium]
MVAPLFLWLCKVLANKNIIHRIIAAFASKNQIQFERLHSLKSIFIFGFSILPVIYLIRKDIVILLPNTFINILIGILILTIWNEIHFFIVHRIMHIPFFMKKVHRIHHKSKIPTVYSVYSFHWFEALLLSTVPITIIIFIPFSPLAIFLYPLCSILLNYAGHCNYRFGNGKGKNWYLFGTLHNEHHYTLRKNYGFASNILDKLFVKRRTKKSNSKKQL